MRYCPNCARHVVKTKYRIRVDVTGWDESGPKTTETAHPCPVCDWPTLEVAWVSTTVPWKPWTWGRGHWQFDYQGTGPTRWWRRFKVQDPTTESEDG